MKKIKTGFQAFGLFFLTLLIFGFFPQNTLMSWICFIVSIAIIVVFIAKSRNLAIGLTIVYLIIGIIYFVISGGFSAMIDGATHTFSEIGPKLSDALTQIIGFGIICYVLYRLFIPKNRGNERYKDISQGKKRKQEKYEDYYDNDEGYVSERREKHHSANMQGLGNGTDKYWKVKEQAERIYQHRVDAHSSSEREIWIKNGNEFADRLREKYGFDDPDVEFIIEKYYLDHTS